MLFTAKKDILKPNKLTKLKKNNFIFYFFVIDVNECSANPCKNGGKCTNTHGSYRCTCDSRFTGKNCDQGTLDRTLWNMKMIQHKLFWSNRNALTVLLTLFYLSYHNLLFFCLDVDECKVRNPCKNGATCKNSVGGYSCQCPSNYKGKHCDEGKNRLDFIIHNVI